MCGVAMTIEMKRKRLKNHHPLNRLALDTQADTVLARIEVDALTLDLIPVLKRVLKRVLTPRLDRPIYPRLAVRIS